MDLAGLEALVAQGESERLDSKKSTGELHAGMETLCGFLNGPGGKVLFGVTNAGRIVGRDVSDSTLQGVANAIRRIEPTAWIELTRIRVGDDKEVLMLEAAELVGAPYTFDGRPFQRIGPTTSRMPQAEYERQLLSRTHELHRWESQFADVCCPESKDAHATQQPVGKSLAASGETDAELRAVLRNRGQAVCRQEDLLGDRIRRRDATHRNQDPAG